MGKQPTDPRDARTFRVYARHSGEAAEIFSKEVVALYHQHEDGFVVFKDAAHAAVYSVAAACVLEIERLRTHALLAVAHEELLLVIRALREQADRLIACAEDSDGVQEAKRLAFFADSLERLNPVASVRASEDESSLLRERVPA